MLIKNFEQCVAYPSGNTAFQDQGFYVNPGLASSFPWLSGLAQNFGKFQFRFLRFFFSGSCPTTTTGKVWMQVTYDWMDNAPSSLAQTLASDDSAAGPAWFGGAINATKAFSPGLTADSNIFVDVDCTKFAEPYYYVRDTGVTQSSGGGVSAGAQTFTPGTVADPTAIPCRVFYGNNGVSSSVVPGELYASYIIELLEPIASAQGL
jgi:hypothetical protein